MTSQMGQAIWATDLTPHLPCYFPSSLVHTLPHSRELCYPRGPKPPWRRNIAAHGLSSEGLAEDTGRLPALLLGSFSSCFLEVNNTFYFKIYPFKSTFYCYYFCLFAYTSLFLYGFELLFFFHADPLSISKFQTSIDFYHLFYCLLDLG